MVRPGDPPVASQNGNGMAAGAYSGPVQYARPPYLTVAPNACNPVEDDGDLWDIYQKTTELIRTYSSAKLSATEKEQLDHLRKLNTALDERLHKLAQLRYDIDDIERDRATSLSRASESRNSISPQDIDSLRIERDSLKQRLQSHPNPAAIPIAIPGASPVGNGNRCVSMSSPLSPPPPGVIASPELIRDRQNSTPNASFVGAVSSDSWICNGCGSPNPISLSTCQPCQLHRDDEAWAVI